jgi:hypothetical protein
MEVAGAELSHADAYSAACADEVSLGLLVHEHALMLGNLNSVPQVVGYRRTHCSR